MLVEVDLVEGGQSLRFQKSLRMTQRQGRLLMLHILVPSHLGVVLGVKSFNIRDFDLDHGPQPPKEVRSLHPFSGLYKHLLDEFLLGNMGNG